MVFLEKDIGIKEKYFTLKVEGRKGGKIFVKNLKLAKAKFNDCT